LAGFDAPPVASERTQSTALESSNATISVIMQNINRFVSACHAGGMARAGAVAASTEQMLTTCLLACLTKMYSAYGKYFN
jgi:hypothetical protein